MSSTDSALDWLLSLRAICASSPEPTSASPNFTDWLHISPRSDSPTATQSTSDFPYSSSPFRDVLFSSRVNRAQGPQQASHHGPFGFARFEKIADPSLHADDITAIIDSHEVYHVASPAVSLNEHHRMLSLDSTSATLINTPSPQHPNYYHHLKLEDVNFDRTIPFSFSPAAFSSPSTKLIRDLEKTFYESYYCDLSAASLPVHTISDISPILRADTKEVNENMKKKKGKKHRRNVPRTSSFAERLRAVPFQEPFMSGPETHHQPIEQLGHSLLIGPAGSAVPDAGFPPRSVLLSPCRLTPPSSHALESPVAGSATSKDKVQNDHVLDGARSGLSFTPVSVENLSPLTPISSSPQSPPRLKIILKLKRPAPEPATPVRRSKRARIQIESSPPSEEPTAKTLPASPEYEPCDEVEGRLIFYTNRTLPDNIEISDNFPLFYRRFPVSSFYQPSEFSSPCTLFGVTHPGGTYNPPRSSLDLYSPRFVKGKGVEKVGLCPICIEPRERGGERKKLWLAMKFSAFKYYHMQYAHGISAATGLPFSPPTSFRIITRPNPGKKEKTKIQQGKCHKCRKWVAVEGIKDMESKVIELHWWKHAAACHHDSTLEGEGDYYEEDSVFFKIQSLHGEAA